MSAEWMARRTRRASGLVISFWGLLAANTWVAAVRVGVTGSDVSFVALVLVAVVAIRDRVGRGVLPCDGGRAGRPRPTHGPNGKAWGRLVPCRGSISGSTASVSSNQIHASNWLGSDAWK